jgi:hypothetical protein
MSTAQLHKIFGRTKKTDQTPHKTLDQIAKKGDMVVFSVKGKYSLETVISKKLSGQINKQFYDKDLVAETGMDYELSGDLVLNSQDQSANTTRQLSGVYDGNSEQVIDGQNQTVLKVLIPNNLFAQNQIVNPLAQKIILYVPILNLEKLRFIKKVRPKKLSTK